MNFKIKPLFTKADIEKDISKHMKVTHDLIINELSLVGLKWATAAREKTPDGGSFNDQTGNLRSSIGYVVLHDGEIAKIDFETSISVDSLTGKIDKHPHSPYSKKSSKKIKVKVTAELGMGAGIRYGKQVAADYPTGYALILVAGMEYASFVEAKDFDVITGSTLNADKDIKSAYESVKIALKHIK